MRTNANPPKVEDIERYVSKRKGDTDPLSPKEAEARFQVPDDLQFQMVLGDPEIAQPLFMTFDARGRLWVLEYRQYPDIAGVKIMYPQNQNTGEVLVTGAAGGVGSVAVAILAKLGFNVVAATGRPQEGAYLKSLGATTILERKELLEAPDRPLLSERFAGVVDTVSGTMLAKALLQVKYGGAAAVCGLAAGATFPGSILPFILRGVAMYGIDSVMLPQPPRQEAWRRLGTDLPLDKLDSTIGEAGLGDLPALAPKILKGEIRGRVVVDVNK
mgnify:CR=1 FL=1